MPKDTNAHNCEQFVMISVSELQTLTRLNASGRTIQCLIALRSFAWDGRTCFPSIKAIAERMGLTNKTSKQSVLTALKWLEDNGLIVRNHKQAKDRFVITTSEERGAGGSVSPTSSGSQSACISRRTQNNTQLTPNPQRGRQRKRRFNKWEKRQRKYERKVAIAEAEIAEVSKNREEEANFEQAKWLVKHREAQDKIIALNGTKILDEQVSLLMARMDYESRSHLWTYEPAPIHELGLNEDLVAFELRKLSTLRNPYCNVFGFGWSLNQIQDWFKDNRGD